MVEDRHGTGLPYSKGLMAGSIMAAGVAPEQAHWLAALVESELRAAGLRRVDADHLVRVAVAVLTRHAGADLAQRYLAWRAAKRSSRPVAVLIGGVTGVGKSTVATTLATRLDITRVIPTDAVRQVMRGLLSPADAPEIHHSSFEATADPVHGFMWQAATVVGGVAGVIERMAAERKDVIVEGVHLVPGTFPADTLVGLQRHAAVVQVVLTVEDPEVHRSHFLHRLDNEHGRQPHRYLAAFDRIRRLHDHVRDLAVRHGVPTVDAGSLDHAVQEVLGLVVGAVTSESGSLAVEAS